MQGALRDDPLACQVAVRQNIKMLAPHFPASLVPRFIDQQVLCSKGACSLVCCAASPGLVWHAHERSNAHQRSP
jgi:hypothetical protein